MVDVYLRDVPAGNANDPWLFDPENAGILLELGPVPLVLMVPGIVVTRLPRPGITPGDDRPRIRREGERELSPLVAVSLLNDLTARYGTGEGHRIYRAMESERKGPFAPGKKYDPERGRRRRK